MKYDDFIVGETFKTKSLHITEEEIIQFATTFDPQYMHIDKEKVVANWIISSSVI
ncbi:hypothetical protein V322_02727 [Staphylococcus aureus F19466]|nr:hypothetical protein V322_02727 [Staphylococcus aureus F19466]